MREIRNILVGIDYSEYSREAARYAVYFAKSLGANVHFLHVSELPAYIGTGIGPYGLASLKNHLSKEQELKDQKLEEMKTFVAEFEDKGVQTSHLVSFGNPPVEIIRISKDMEIDMIVLGTHGRKGISQFIIGSVAEKVVRKSTCPVLTIKLIDQSFTMSG